MNILIVHCGFQIIFFFIFSVYAESIDKFENKCVFFQASRETTYAKTSRFYRQVCEENVKAKC